MKSFHYAALVLVLASLSLGCGGNDLENQVLELNKTNVAKVRTCFDIFASRHALQAPKDKAELVAFLNSEPINKRLKMIGINPQGVEDIFISERDGEPLKIRWGGVMNPDRPKPIAFEAVGVDGVRLVAADELLEVENDERYEELWQGKYVPAYIEAMNAEPSEF